MEEVLCCSTGGGTSFSTNSVSGCSEEKIESKQEQTDFYRFRYHTFVYKLQFFVRNIKTYKINNTHRLNALRFCLSKDRPAATLPKESRPATRCRSFEQTSLILDANASNCSVWRLRIVDMLPAFSLQQTAENSRDIINSCVMGKITVTAYRKGRKTKISQYFFPFDVRQLYQISEQTKRVTALQSIKDDS